MRKSDIARFRGQFGVGQIINVIKETSSERKMKVEAEIVGIYPYFCLVQLKENAKYRWSVKWVYLMMEKGIV